MEKHVAPGVCGAGAGRNPALGQPACCGGASSARGALEAGAAGGPPGVGSQRPREGVGSRKGKEVDQVRHYKR